MRPYPRSVRRGRPCVCRNSGGMTPPLETYHLEVTGFPYTVTDADAVAGQVSACFKVPALGLSTHVHYEFKSLGHTEVP